MDTVLLVGGVYLPSFLSLAYLLNKDLICVARKYSLEEKYFPPSILRFFIFNATFLGAAFLPVVSPSINKSWMYFC